MDNLSRQERSILKSEDMEASGVVVSHSKALDIADTGVGDSPRVGSDESIHNNDGQDQEESQPASIVLPSRPQIRRDQPQPPPPQQPPPPPGPHQVQQSEPSTDSLSLMQLKRIVTDMPRVEPAAYAFTYEDTASFPEEIEEWFTYDQDERRALLDSKMMFDMAWNDYKRESGSKDTTISWMDADKRVKRKFVESQIAGLNDTTTLVQSQRIAALLYVVLGVWGDPACFDPDNVGETVSSERTLEATPLKGRYKPFQAQIQHIHEGATLLLDLGAAQAVFDILINICSPSSTDQQTEGDVIYPEDPISRRVEGNQTTNALTLMYVFVESARHRTMTEPGGRARDAVASLCPEFLLFFVDIIARLRWEDSTQIPLTKARRISKSHLLYGLTVMIQVLLLFWKSVLLLFGGSEEVEQAKSAVSVEPSNAAPNVSKVLKTASPLDYHVFRQEITSKYPAYNPPPPLLPLELEQTSILPPFPSLSSKSTSSGASTSIGPASVNGNGGSIIHQPVHIATPAPSPPPSPIGPGGKAGKKQNYQTNQNFPFLYPPSDPYPPELGNGSAYIFRDPLNNKQWEGSDIPVSILEAGELFAGRMVMARGIRQLWDERERFMKYDRGWEPIDNNSGAPPPGRRTGKDDLEHILDDSVRRRLALVEDFYSVVIVLLKLVLANVTALISQPNGTNGQNGLAPGFQPQETESPVKSKGKDSIERQPNGFHGSGDVSGDVITSSDEIQCVRSREIIAKAVSGLLLILLKWFKISRERCKPLQKDIADVRVDILKYEYLTQLLLDSNYLPLILKLFAHEEIDKVVDSVTDRDGLGFFSLCRTLSGHEPALSGSPQSSDDEACPPPVVKLARTELKVGPSSPANSSDTNNAHRQPPEVDELGYPATEQPMEPITSFSWRNFFSSINYLRIMQKICKKKAHRNLLLVQYKSSTILKKCLKVPQPELRLYTLKLFKDQVPYCGRKWRQTNMRVITAVYLHCRPELRDDWLAGSDVDAEVGEALPQEQALRALTHWHNLKQYPEQMGAANGMLEEEQDFFIRELEKMDFGEDSSAAEEGDGNGVWEGPLHIDGC
ncbi:MAG: Factor arrest protein 11 [Caeruleum heppii]|nr:MAG: Factor arrest protein 11 [Caeruleum heppii]